MNREAKNPPLSDFLIAGNVDSGWVGVSRGGGIWAAPEAPWGPGQPWGERLGLGWLPEADRGQKDSTILKIPV